MNFKIIRAVLVAASVFGTLFAASNAIAAASNVSCGTCVYPAPATHSAGPVAQGVSCYACHTGSAPMPAPAPTPMPTPAPAPKPAPTPMPAPAPAPMPAPAPVTKPAPTPKVKQPKFKQPKVKAPTELPAAAMEYDSEEE